eukprot:GCRY01000820.1.p1 GENE.GCRY01000820.1~~GCRY01000820.1.p1  ORF type:complete len:123 (+),score=14.23 GCRY01000820.1:260-628(+)
MESEQAAKTEGENQSVVKDVDTVISQAETAATRLSTLMDHQFKEEDLTLLSDLQNSIFFKLSHCNQTLDQFNGYSAQQFELAQTQIKDRVQVIKSMKQDLDFIYKKLRELKGRLNEFTENSS